MSFVFSSGDYASWTPTWIFLNTLGNVTLFLGLIFLAVKLFGMSRQDVDRLFISVNRTWFIMCGGLLLMISIDQLIYVFAVMYVIVPISATMKAITGIYALLVCMMRDITLEGTSNSAALSFLSKTRH